MTDVPQRISSLNPHSLSMDPELKQYLDDREARMIQLLIDIKESLERQMDTRFGEVNQRFDAMDARFDAVDARFDAQAARLDRQAALIQSGARWSARMTEWSEKVDITLDKYGQQITDLNKRVDKKIDKKDDRTQ